MLALIERIRERLAQSAYANEAAISHGVVTPVLNGLGWDSADPTQVVPEFSAGRGRVDFALFGRGPRPSVFIEVKGVGRAVEGDRQLFEYAFHQGVPLCVLTDGREWSFYLPSGHGSYEDRRVYRLQLDDRDPAECERILTRYLACDRVRGGQAFEDAVRDYRDVTGQREAVTALPRAWRELLAQPEDLLLDTVADRAEALCGYKPGRGDVLAFLRGMTIAAVPETTARRPRAMPSVTTEPVAAEPVALAEPSPREVTFTMFGTTHTCANASVALIEVLRILAARDPSKIPALADAVRTGRLNHIAQTVAEINPLRPDLARAAEFSPGWLVGLNIANRDKIAIIRSAAAVYNIAMPGDLDIALPNAK